MTIEYDEALVEQITHTLDLRAPNSRALSDIAKALDGATDGQEIIADLATGVGKTYIAGGLLDYLFESGVRNVVIVTPGSTIQSKTVNNLTPGHRKYLRGLQCNPLVITLDTLERGEVGAALEDDNRFKVFVFTVQSLLRPNTNDARRAHRSHETLGQDLYSYLQGADDLVVIADEHHVYFSTSAKKFQAAINDLHPTALVGLTATPHEKSLDSVVTRYPLSDAIADGYVKIPVLVSRQDSVKDVRTQLADGLTLLDRKVEAMRAYCDATHKPYVEPIMFLVASTIDEANEFKDILTSVDMLGAEEKVLLVTSEEPDKTLALLDTLEDVGSPIRAVVSVSMLKEGWDVKNIYVIASVRKMESQLLTEQILGRGLRLPFGERTGNPMLDTVEVLSHHAFSTLLKQASVLLEETLGDRANSATVVVNPTPGKHVYGVPVAPNGGLPADAEATTSGEVQVHLPGPPPSVDEQLGDEDAEAEDSHLSMAFATMDSRVAAADDSAKILGKSLLPRNPGGLIIPFHLPRVITSWHREPFSLGGLDLVDVEALGRRFAKDDAPTLVRKSLDATRDDEGRAHVVIADAQEQVVASQASLPFDSIETDLVTRLMSTNSVEATVREANAALRVARAFLNGAQVTEDTTWRAEHGRLATTRLVEWIENQRKSHPAREVFEVSRVQWPEPPEQLETRPPADRHVITQSSEFTRNYPYSGWSKSVYELNSFDAYSTEFNLAVIFDGPKGVKAWFRIDESVPLRIAYTLGSVQRSYEPDFIAIEEEGTHWIVEGKRNSEMTSDAVLAKRDAAAAWVRTVNSSGKVDEHWAYLLASEDVIASSGSWAGLKNGGQAFQ